MSWLQLRENLKLTDQFNRIYFSTTQFGMEIWNFQTSYFKVRSVCYIFSVSISFFFFINVYGSQSVCYILRVFFFFFSFSVYGRKIESSRVKWRIQIFMSIELSSFWQYNRIYEFILSLPHMSIFIHMDTIGIWLLLYFWNKYLTSILIIKILECTFSNKQTPYCFCYG